MKPRETKHLCLIMESLDMKDQIGAATVMDMLMYGWTLNARTKPHVLPLGHKRILSDFKISMLNGLVRGVPPLHFEDFCRIP